MGQVVIFYTMQPLCLMFFHLRVQQYFCNGVSTSCLELMISRHLLL